MNTDPISRLALELGRLPGIGERSATRLAFYVIKKSLESAEAGLPALAVDLAEALVDVTQSVHFCEQCFNLTSASRCNICSAPGRDSSILCVVESVSDLRAIETSGAFRGVYHVLHGVLAPLDGVGPEDIKLRELFSRLRDDEIQEVILATNADVEGDATALYIARMLKGLPLNLSRLASGIPLGGELEFVDQATIGRALNERRQF
ncbi:recombination protein RecR [Myxococcota bacterium]|nr:recombination protein RecR [Myxococcota bacterium]